MLSNSKALSFILDSWAPHYSPLPTVPMVCCGPSTLAPLPRASPMSWLMSHTLISAHTTTKVCATRAFPSPHAIDFLCLHRTALQCCVPSTKTLHSCFLHTAFPALAAVRKCMPWARSVAWRLVSIQLYPTGFEFHCTGKLCSPLPSLQKPLTTVWQHHLHLQDPSTVHTPESGTTRQGNMCCMAPKPATV